MSSSLRSSRSAGISVLHSPIARRTAFGAGLAVAAAALAACSSTGSASGSGRPTVMTTAYALSYLVTTVAGDAADVVDLAKPGVDAHGLELSVAEVAQLAAADLVVAIPGFQTAVDDALESHGTDNALLVDSVITLLASDGEDEHDHDASDEGGDEEEHDHGTTDPHFWHDPARMADVATAIGARLAEVDPDNASTYTANAEALRSELDALDAELAETFGAISGDKPFVTSHTAFAYLAARYDLEQIGITGIDPEVEPSPQRLLSLETVIKEQGVTTVFFETTASPKVAQTLADNIGIETAELDNLETQLDSTVTYPEVMRSNAEALVASWS